MIAMILMMSVITVKDKTSSHRWFRRTLSPEHHRIKQYLNCLKVWNQYRAERLPDLVCGSSLNRRCMTSYCTAVTSENARSV